MVQVDTRVNLGKMAPKRREPEKKREAEKSKKPEGSKVSEKSKELERINEPGETQEPAKSEELVDASLVPLSEGKSSVKASTVPKKPPPEKSENIRTRRLVIASFWVVVILLGLPIWLWTTSIHGAVLPLDEMLDWADGKVSILLICIWATEY